MTPTPRTDAPFSVLVVDDNADHAASLADLLMMFGYSTRTALNGFDALRLAAESPPDVVLLDLMMPGMSGHELARRLTSQATDRRPLLVALSALGNDEARKRSAEAGIDLHLVKPAEPGMLFGVMERFRVLIAPPGCDTAEHFPVAR
jgi:CheY-like chemotaxis protein